MNIKMILWNVARKNGSFAVKLSINHNGSRDYYQFKLEGIKQYALNNKKVTEFEDGLFTKSKRNYIALNSHIRTEITRCEGLCEKNPTQSAKQIVALMDSNGLVNTDSFMGYFSQIIADAQSGKKEMAMGTFRIYRKTFDRLKEFNEQVMYTDFSTINKVWYDKFVNWLKTGKKDVKGRTIKRGPNTVGTYIKIIKVILNMAVEDKVTNITEHKMKYFKAMQEQSDGIYLTEEEIALIANVDLTHYIHLENERDRFLLSYYFLLRFSDSMRFKKSNFIETKNGLMLKMHSLKTKTLVNIPVSKAAHDLLKKHNYVMPCCGDISEANALSNRYIKDICRLAGITELVECGKKTRPKYEFVTTHTARRSGATNLFLQGMPQKYIMDIGGWADPKCFMLYNKISLLESAEKAMNYPFFNGGNLKVA